MIDLNDTGKRETITKIIRQAAFKIFDKSGALHELASNQLIDDIVHDVFCKILEKNKKGGEINYSTSWIWSVTTNHCIDWLRRRKEILLDEVKDKDQKDTSSQMDFVAEPDWEESNNIVEALASNDYAEKAFKDIDKDDIEIYRLHKIYGLTPKEIKKLKGKDFKKTFFYDKIIMTEIKSLFESALFDKTSFDYDLAQFKLSSILNRLSKEKRLKKELKFIKNNSITELAHCKMNQGDINGPYGAMALFEKADKLWKELKHPEKELYVIQMIGVCNKITGNYSKALDIFISLAELIENKKNYKNTKGSILHNIGSAYMYLNNLNDAKILIEKSVNLNENVGTEQLRISQKELGLVYVKRGKHDIGYKLIQESLQDIPHYNVLHHLKAKLALCELYLETGDLQSSHKILTWAKEIARKYGFHHQYHYRVRPYETRYRLLAS